MNKVPFNDDKLWLVLIAAFLLSTMLGSWLALTQIRSNMEKEIEEKLQTVLQTTQSAIDLWVDDCIDDGQHLARRPDLQFYIKELLALLHSNKKMLAVSPVQEKLLPILNQSMMEHNDAKLFVIAPDLTIISSTTETHLGQKSRIAATGNALDKVFQGSPQLIFPFLCMGNRENTQGEDFVKELSISVVVPCLDEKGTAFAALVYHLDPSQDFSRIIQLTRTGTTGEAYAFNNDGLLISESRFIDQLRSIGRLTPEQSAILTIAPRDPGGNMLDGFQPRGRQYSWPFTLMATQAFINGEGGNVTGYRDYRGVPVVGAWTWLSRHDFGFAFEMDMDEAFSVYYLIRRTFIGLYLMIVFLSLGIFCILMKKTEETKAANQQLAEEVIERQQSENKFRMLIESSPDGILIINRKGAIILVNRQLEQLFGYSREELEGRKVELLIPNRFVDQHPKNRDSFLKNPHIRPMGDNLDLWGLRKDGSEFPVEIGLSPVKIGEKMETIASIRDISTRKEQEKALLGSEEKFRLAMEATEDGLWDWNLISGRVYYSPSWCRIIGYKPDEVNTDYGFWESHIYDQDRATTLATLETHLTGETPFFESEHRLLTKDKQKKWVRYRGKIVSYTAEGVPQRMVGTMSDIAARKQIEEELRHHHENLEKLVDRRTRKLRENKEKLQYITSSAQMAIIMIDNRGNITFWNKAAVRIFGWEVEEVLGKDLHQHIMPEQYKEGHRNAFAVFQKTGQGKNIGLTVELSAIRKNGDTFPVELAMSAVKVQGKWNAIGLVTDISTRKETEKQLHLYVEEMERFGRLAVGREQRMIHLKEEINVLCDQLGLEKKYRIVQ